MICVRPVNNAEFRVGDKVVLAEGPYQGTPGIFLTLREDVNWADIKELNFRSMVRCHPVIWLQHSDPLGITEQGETRESAMLVPPRMKEHTK